MPDAATPQIAVKLVASGNEWLGEIVSNDPEDPRPFLLPGVRVEFAPIGRKAVRAARDAVREALGLDETDLVGAADALSEELIRRGITAWEGVGDQDGNVIPVTPDAVAIFLGDIGRFEAADRIYVRPWSRRDMEGNVSAGSPIGTSAEATPADDIAISPAATEGQPEALAAKRARTASTSRRPKKAKPSGK
ncbi:hypothetical protein [Sphingomonas nostoxanthinifaciens]|uniref:hypothetical protein n=1 Tax=Sphingomonas nostoxanthinifaciens TaxID=2872652 RepID=UPI001CC21E3B|nr:hypothetical protein [Sphingomonas nostoxanthinifaciens]UAK24183.1 hypothetical protein K8P63_17930 [Sphingomonas nostoxanthinifaciens]